jgi:methionyl-tRNA formyltransferase
MPAKQIKDMVRATPGKCYFYHDGKKIFAFEAREVESGMEDKSPGMIISIDDRQLLVSTAENSLALLSLGIVDNEKCCMSQIINEIRLKAGDCIAWS